MPVHIQSQHACPCVHTETCVQCDSATPTQGRFNTHQARGGRGRLDVYHRGKPRRRSRRKPTMNTTPAYEICRLHLLHYGLTDSMHVILISQSGLDIEVYKIRNFIWSRMLNSNNENDQP